MTLIKSISGIRGTIGGKKSDNFTPIDIVECVSAYGTWVKENHPEKPTIVLGRDGRISGPLVTELTVNTLLAMGINVIDGGLSTTPTIEMAVMIHQAQGGIILTASHNPKQWNALKFLNHKGEFISGEVGNYLLELIEKQDFNFATVEELGQRTNNDQLIAEHIQAILKLEHLDVDQIKAKSYHVIIDCINSTGAISIPPLLDKLNCTYELINGDINGEFEHNPEPLEKNLGQLIEAVKSGKADMGIAVDPDVDRLAIICEDGSYFGEEYTLVTVADYLLSKTSGDTVSNLSSTRALSDITQQYNGHYHASAVGEVNVVNKMKEVNAVIGGEGNGGIIYPGLHYGRDALVGIAFILGLMAERNQALSTIRKSYTDYQMIKDKMPFSSLEEYGKILASVEKAFASEKLNKIDGLKIDFEAGWVHLRKSNTEAIIRIYAEAKTQEKALALINLVKSKINQ